MASKLKTPCATNYITTSIQPKAQMHTNVKLMLNQPSKLHSN